MKQLLPVTLFVLLAGCSSTSSENVDSEGIHADFEIHADSSGQTFVYAELEVGDGLGATSLRVTGGDRLLVTANGIERTMTQDRDVLGRFRYEATFAFDDGGTLFTVAFMRDNDRSAPNSTATLPDGFVVQAPANSPTYGRNDDIAIAWLPSGTPVVPDIEVWLTCSTNLGTHTVFERVTLSSDTGASSLPVAAVIPNSTLDESQLCEGSVLFSRFVRGSLDPNFGEGGRITAQQTAQAAFFVDLTR